MNSFAGIFWLVLAQLQNHFFIEHLPVAAYVRFLKEKDILLCGITRFSRGNKNKLRTFQPQKWKKIRTVSLKQNLLVLKKKSVIIFEQINMNLSNYRGKNFFVSLRFCFVLLFLFDCILKIVPIALIALEAAIKRREVL